MSTPKTEKTIKEAFSDTKYDLVVPDQDSAMNITINLINDKIIQNKVQKPKTKQNETLKKDKPFVLTSFNSSSTTQKSPSKNKKAEKVKENAKVECGYAIDSRPGSSKTNVIEAFPLESPSNKLMYANPFVKKRPPTSPKKHSSTSKNFY